jgi:hypothetical protein
MVSGVMESRIVNRLLFFNRAFQWTYAIYG